MVEVCEDLSGEEDSYEEGSNDDYGAPLEGIERWRCTIYGLAVVVNIVQNMICILQYDMQENQYESYI